MEKEKKINYPLISETFMTPDIIYSIIYIKYCYNSLIN